MASRSASRMLPLLCALLLAAYAVPVQALFPHQESEKSSGTAALDSRRAVERPGWASRRLDAPAVAGNSPLGHRFVIRDDPEQEVDPSIAYNSQRQEYLVVWYNDRDGCDDIRAQRLSMYGGLAGPAFYISAGCPADRRYPKVAYNIQHDQYLVVWEHYEVANGYSIKGRRVSGAGVVLDATDITVSAASNLYTPAKPAVAYASTSDRYLVVWAETWHPMPITYSIAGQVMTAVGALEGSQLSISSGSDRREEPDVVYNRHANRYLVVWQQQNGSLFDIHGQQVHGGGGLYQGDITIAYYTNSSTLPAVAALPTSPTAHTFMVVWEFQTAPTDKDLYGRLVAEDGTPGADFWVAWDGTHNETSPAIAGDESGRRYMVAWRYDRGATDKPILAHVFSHTGALLGPADEFAGIGAAHPAVMSGPAGDFMVAWEDQPVSVTHTNLYGQLWGNRLHLPLLARSSH